MAVEIVAGNKYRNRRGEYEVLEITSEARLKVRYLQDGSVADLDLEQQLRILTNMQIEEQSQALALANAKPASTRTTTSRTKTTATAKSASKAATARPASTRQPAPAAPHPAVNARSAAISSSVELRPTVPVRQEFTKTEVLLLLQFMGFGNQDGKYWFIGNQEVGPADGNTILSERNEEVEFHKEFTDAEIYKLRYRTETNYAYGSPVWQYANYLISQLVLPPEEQNDAGRQKYFEERFGASDGDVLLIDTTSLPTRSSDADQWPYRNATITDSPRYHNVLREPKLFLEDQLFGQETRYKRISELYQGLKLQKSAPSYIFCFGRLAAWRGYKEIFPQLHTYNDLELHLYSDKERTTRLSIAQDPESGTHIVLLPPLSPQGSEGMTYHYLDQVASILLTLKMKETKASS